MEVCWRGSSDSENLDQQTSGHTCLGVTQSGWVSAMFKQMLRLTEADSAHTDWGRLPKTGWPQTHKKNHDCSAPHKETERPLLTTERVFLQLELDFSRWMDHTAAPPCPCEMSQAVILGHFCPFFLCLRLLCLDARTKGRYSAFTTASGLEISLSWSPISMMMWGNYEILSNSCCKTYACGSVLAII